MILPHVHALNQKRIVLASGSPRRRELLTNLGLKFEVLVSSFDETLPKNAFPRAADYAVATAKHKALDVAAICRAQAKEAGQRPVDLIISADTVVEHEGLILEKPNDEPHAAEMLARLSGSQHHVHTGVVLLLPHAPAGGGAAGSSRAAHSSNGSSNGGSGSSSGGSEPLVRCFSCTTSVLFDELSPELISAYVRSGEPFGKAGSYGIQGTAGSFVRGIDGCFYNVVGFPVHAFSKELLALVRDGYLPLPSSAVVAGAAAGSNGTLAGA